MDTDYNVLLGLGVYRKVFQGAGCLPRVNAQV